jgi:hypothetical protein
MKYRGQVSTFNKTLETIQLYYKIRYGTETAEEVVSVEIIIIVSNY